MKVTAICGASEDLGMTEEEYVGPQNERWRCAACGYVRMLSSDDLLQCERCAAPASIQEREDAPAV